jgi:hypothetical protein
LEWIVLICGFALFAIGVLAGHVGWWRAVLLAGLVLVASVGFRVRGRRIDAIRARPPL